jgi:hypothetical protein
MCALMKLANLGVLGLASGPLHGCAVCAEACSARALHSLCADFNFSLRHLARCASSGIQVKPPNVELFLFYSEYAALLTGSTNASACDAAAALACSDFNAATPLARTSEKVCVLFPALSCGCCQCR